MGNAYMKLKKYADAQQAYSKAIELNSNFATAYLNRGACKEMQRDFEGAVNDWKKAGELGIEKANSYISYYK